MVYKNGKEVLPAWLLKELQEYIQGDLIYIPRKEDKKAGWGELSGARVDIRKRNAEIYYLYKNGINLLELTQKFHLSEDSIRKIIANNNKELIHGTLIKKEVIKIV
jgi:Mor family transcriptional regulator